MGGGSFERSFYRSASFVQRKIINRFKLIVEESLHKEIILTIEEIYGDKLDDTELSKIWKIIPNGELNITKIDILLVQTCTLIQAFGAY